LSTIIPQIGSFARSRAFLRALCSGSPACAAVGAAAGLCAAAACAPEALPTYFAGFASNARRHCAEQKQ
jgi:hypothetical protein